MQNDRILKCHIYKQMQKYFYSFPKLALISSNNEANSNNEKSNYENPLKRQRSNLNPKKTKGSNDKSFPYPSSYFPDIFFKNTVPHPYLIFYNLHLKDLETENGKKKLAPKDYKDSIIDQLNDYFGVNDILSFSSLKNDFNKILETWNNRFPDAKSSSFSPVREDFRIEDIQDLQSLHFLAFQLNTIFYLLFKIDKNGETQYYNMKLGPESSSYDIHFLVSENVDKEGHTYKRRDNSEVTIYNHQLWLSLRLIEISSKCENKNNNFKPSTQQFNSSISNGVIFLEMEKRDPIPFIPIPDVTNDFSRINFSYNEINEGLNYKGSISFETLEKKVKEHKYKELKIKVSAKKKYAVKVNKFKSIATKLTSHKSSTDASNTPAFERFFFAQMNRSAFLINEQEENSEVNHIMEVLFDDNKKALCFPSITDKILNKKINDCIISYRKRLKYPLTYKEIASSNHPLIGILCTNKVINIMLKSADYLNDEIGRDKTTDVKSEIRIVPIEDDKKIFYEYKDYKKCVPTKKIDDIMEIWKKLADTYPQMMSPAAYIFNKSDYTSSINMFKQDDNPLFSYFYTCLSQLHGGFYMDLKSTFQPISDATIIHFRQNKIGLNPILVPVIYKEFMQLCKTCCIYFFSNKKFNEPVNDILMRDIQTIKEFKSRTTTEIFKDEKVVEENAKMGAFPIKKKTFIKMLQLKGNKPIPDPSFDFNDPKKDLLDEILNSQKMDLVSNEPNYRYQFFPVINNDIIYVTRFEIFSCYKLKYIYVTRGNVYSVGEGKDKENKEKKVIAYGTCQALDTEMRFEKLIEGEFADAVYLEENSCLIICYKKDNHYYFTGYDKKGQINESPIDFNDDVKSLTVISRTFFASYNGSNEVEKGISVFEYNPADRKIEYNKYSEKWRVAENNFGRADLYKKYLQNEANREDAGYQPSFIGSTNSTNSSMSTFCLYKYDDSSHSLIQSDLHQISTLPTLSFSFESNNGSNNNQDEENALLEKRIRNKGEVNVIPSMFNVCPISKDKKNYTNFDLQCTICELFPIPIVMNNRIITYSKDMLSFYSCGYEIYRTISNQIYGFYINTKTRISLFSIETLLNNYNFNKVHVVLIVDTCGIGAKFSNMFYGTRFDEKDVLTDEIWAGFSYSNDEASIIFVLRINDLESLYNAINIDNFNPTIFYCKKTGVVYSIKLGYYKELILVGNSNKSNSQYTEITFISNTEFQNNIVQLKDKYKVPSFDTRTESLEFAKTIIANYLTFHTFDSYPLQTIKKYAKDSYPEMYNIGKFMKEIKKQ